MNKSIERKPNPILALPTVRLFALVAFVDRDGNLKDRDGFAGEIIDCSAVSISEGAIWTPLDGSYAGEVLQHHPLAIPLLKRLYRIRTNGYAIKDVSTVVVAGIKAKTGAFLPLLP